MQYPCGLTQGHTLLITVGEVLDSDMYLAFRQLYEDRRGDIDTYVVDFGRTQCIDNGGLGLLLLLREYAGGDRGCVRLVNTGAMVRYQLGAENIASLFDVT